MVSGLLAICLVTIVGSILLAAVLWGLVEWVAEVLHGRSR